MIVNKKLKSVVLGLRGRPETPGTAEWFCNYLKNEGADVEFMDCIELIRRPGASDNTDLSRFLAGKPGVEAVYCHISERGSRDLFLSWARELKLQTPNFIHPKAEIDPVVKKKIEDRPNAGIYIFENAKIGPNVEIGDFSIIMQKVCIAQDAKLEYGVFISRGTKLGKGCTVCRHSCVDEDVPDGATVAGDPAEILKPEDLTDAR